MKDFRPPKLQRKNSETTVTEVLLLNKIYKKPVFVSNVNRKVTGGSMKNYYELQGIDAKAVLFQLRSKNWVRENTNSEALPYLSKSELEELVKSISQFKSSLNKDKLVQLILDYHLENKPNRLTINKFYEVTATGQTIIKKYKNLIWLNENKSNFLMAFSQLKYDEAYFLEHPSIEPETVLIPYYQTRDSGITARLYDYFGDIEKSVNYTLKALAEAFNKDLQFFNSNYADMSAFDGPFSNAAGILERLQTQLNALNVTSDSMDELLKYVYDNIIINKSALSYQIFLELYESALHLDSQAWDKACDKINAGDNETNHQDSIGHFDVYSLSKSDLLEIRTIIENRLAELNNCIDE